MTRDKQERIEACIQELAALLYEEADQSQLQDLEGIEKTVRQQVLEHVSPNIALFLLRKRQEQKLTGAEKYFC
jgi:hypothetical protein